MWQNSASFFACSLPMERLPLTGLGLLSRRICRRLTIPDRLGEEIEERVFNSRRESGGYGQQRKNPRFP
jgi:hypothetical protein